MKTATGDWNQHYATYFLGGSSPLDVKFQIEKATGV